MSQWIKQFLLAGLAGLIRPKHNQHYSVETKLAAVKEYLAGKSTNQAIQEMINYRYTVTKLTYGTRLNKVRLHVVLDLYGQYPINWLITPLRPQMEQYKFFNKHELKKVR